MLIAKEWMYPSSNTRAYCRLSGCFPSSFDWNIATLNARPKELMAVRGIVSGQGQFPSSLLVGCLPIPLVGPGAEFIKMFEDNIPGMTWKKAPLAP